MENSVSQKLLKLFHVNNWSLSFEGRSLAVEIVLNEGRGSKNRGRCATASMTKGFFRCVFRNFGNRNQIKSLKFIYWKWALSFLCLSFVFGLFFLLLPTSVLCNSLTIPLVWGDLIWEFPLFTVCVGASIVSTFLGEEWCSN